jgi:hypothetical protein
VGYTVCAYVLVLGTLALYGLRIESERRELARRELATPRTERGSP